VSTPAYIVWGLRRANGAFFLETHGAESATPLFVEPGVVREYCRGSESELWQTNVLVQPHPHGLWWIGWNTSAQCPAWRMFRGRYLLAHLGAEELPRDSVRVRLVPFLTETAEVEALRMLAGIVLEEMEGWKKTIEGFLKAADRPLTRLPSPDDEGEQK
jgi:hypothetical protein